MARFLRKSGDVILLRCSYFLESRYKIDSSCIIQFHSLSLYSIIMKKIYDQFLILGDSHLIVMHIILEETLMIEEDTIYYLRY
jgi:hypothetical protein